VDYHQIQDILSSSILFFGNSEHSAVRKRNAAAFGTEYTGFTVLEGPLDLFEQFATIMDESSTHVVEKTRTIIGLKGPMVSISEIRKVLESRPID
jgi:hypothetical protein